MMNDRGPGGHGGGGRPHGHGGPPPPPSRGGIWGWGGPMYRGGYRRGCGGCLFPFVLIAIVGAMLSSCMGMIFW